MTKEKAFSSDGAGTIIKTAIEANAIELVGVTADMTDEDASASAARDALYLRTLYAALTAPPSSST